MKYITGWQPIHTKEELSRDFYEVIGPDTLLFNYQKSRGISFELADKYKEFSYDIETKDGFKYKVIEHACFCGDHYEIHSEYFKI